LRVTLEQKRDALKKNLFYLKWQMFERNTLPAVEKKKEYKNTETLVGHTGWVQTLRVLPDGRIVSGSGDKTIKIWDGKPA
jgi:WD40 repeat protein